MSTYRIESISYVRHGVYDVVFRHGSTSTTVRCSVVEHTGIMAVQPDPDIFMAGLVSSPRDVCAAVLAFDRAVRVSGK